MTAQLLIDRIRERFGMPPNARGNWVCTFSGVQYYPTAPRAEDVRIVDIAHALSNLCRYTGHTKKFYSVAEHSVHVSYCVPPEHALTGLLHDAPEFILGDVSRPLKQSLPDYRRIEALNWAVIAEKFGLPITLPQCIHEADVAVLHVERHALMPPMSTAQLAEWPQCDWVAPVTILALPPDAAKLLFLQRFHELTRGKPMPEFVFPNRPVMPLTDAAFA